MKNTDINEFFGTFIMIILLLFMVFMATGALFLDSVLRPIEEDKQNRKDFEELMKKDKENKEI